MEEIKICPYPGLRPFNDDESIFFRGREKNIDTIIELFEKKKFMMLTGASGDGKSSLVYAGIVPKARAGLFKAKYNNWAVADFRPERSPLNNLTHALNKHLKFESEEQLKNEISLGFTSLIKTYKNSPLYIENKNFDEADEAQKKQLKRKAANLLIIADQFEEFFTNAENFNNGAASVESQTVINILLETAKTALAEDIPIYIVCTMRSDYIGQCAAFRGLPEYIGFSQFFVPRLKRKEIQQVIEEPAMLNGDKVSDRLVQRLLFDINDGLDQLPILQHALNQIWKIADNGRQTMDLIHYAKVGGIPANELPQEDKALFDTWFEALPDFKKQLFKNPSLENILNAHANELLENAYEICITRHPNLKEFFTPELSYLVIKTTFQCLTKIDASRAVRNRMTLQEITDIIDHPAIDVKTVGKILDLFRQQGNTFIKPFITEEQSTQKTHKHTVLDITHESLIRNWDILKTWAYEEYDNLINFEDFNKQLQRWINSGKTNGYLLPIGPLTFFENWYLTCKPNKFWLARYDESEMSFEAKVVKAEETLLETENFIKKSANKLFLTRTVMKYGANKIIALFGLILLIGACTFYYLDYRKKQNNYVINEIEEKGIQLLTNNKIKPKVKADFIISYERLHPGTFVNLLNNLNSDTLAYDIALEMFLKCQNFNDFEKPKVNPIIFTLTDYLSKTLNKIYSDEKAIKNDLFFKRYGEFIRLCLFIKSYEKKSHESIDELITQNVDRLYHNYIIAKLDEPIDSLKFDPIIFNNAIELVLNFSNNKEERAKTILSKISPFDDELSRNRFNKLYAKNKRIGENSQFFSHNGGYQELGYLYAITTNHTKVIQCLDSIIKYNPEYKSYRILDFTTLGHFILSNTKFDNQSVNEIFKKYESYTGIPHLKLIESHIHKLQPFVALWEILKREGFGSKSPYNNLLKLYLYRNAEEIFEYYLHEIKKEIKDAQELNYKLALFYKLKGSIPFDRSINEKDFNYKKAFNYYSTLPKDFLNQNLTLGIAGSLDSKLIKRSVLFLYPKPINETESWYPYRIEWHPENTYFQNFIINNYPLNEIYHSENEWAGFENFLYSYYTRKVYDRNANLKFDYKVIDIAELWMKKNKLSKEKIDSNFVFLINCHRYFEREDTLNAMKYYNKIDEKKIVSEEFQKVERPRDEVHKFLIKAIAEQFAIYGKIKQSTNLIYSFREGALRRNCLMDISYKLVQNGKVENSFIFLDSLYKEIDKEPKFGLRLLQVNAMIGGQEMHRLSTKLIKETDDRYKARAILMHVRGLVFNGYYYKAIMSIPDYISTSAELELYTEIMKGEIKTKVAKQNTYNYFWDYDDELKNSQITADEENAYGFIVL